MIITADNIVHYLTGHHFISSQSVVDGDFMAVDMTRRNRNFKIIRKNERGLFVKQVKNFDGPSIASLQREAQSYRLAQHDPCFKAIAALMPRAVHFDASRHVLILELFPDAENLSEMHTRLGNFPAYIASSLGKSLGTYHKEVTRSMEAVRAKKIFPEALPWMLTIDNGYIKQMSKTDAQHAQFFSIIEKFPAFLESIASLRAHWEINSLIHGDMKWDNCIVFKEDAGVEENLTLKIIDWELADLGDAAWDAGAVLQTYLSLWVMSIPGSDNNALSAGQSAKYKIEDMEPAIRAFWQSYIHTLETDKKQERLLLQKCTRYAAIRIIQTVYENMFFSKKLSKNGIYLLQLSLNILNDPAEAISSLLGL